MLLSGAEYPGDAALDLYLFFELCVGNEDGIVRRIVGLQAEPVRGFVEEAADEVAVLRCLEEVELAGRGRRPMVCLLRYGASEN